MRTIFQYDRGGWSTPVSTCHFDFQPCQRYALVIPSGAILAQVIIACWNAGAVAIPLDPRIGHNKIERLIDHCDANYVVTASTIDKREPRLSASRPGDFAIMYTSGSTSNPKGVLLRHEAVQLDAGRVSRWHEWKPDSLTGTCLSLHHCNALSGSLIGTYLAGTDLYLINTSDPKEIMQACELAGLETLHVVPYIVRRMIDQKVKMPDTLKYVLSASAPLLAHDCREWEKLNGPCRITQGYGLTETVNMPFILPRPDLMTPEEWRQLHCFGNPPLGEAPDYCQWYAPLPSDGGVVELVLKGPMLCEYWRDPEATELAMSEHGFKTGDLVSTRVFKGVPMPVYVGRSKDIVNYRGATIYPSDAEEGIRFFLGTHDDVVCFRADDNSEDVLGMAVDGSLSSGEIDLLTSRHYMPVSYYTERILRSSTNKPLRGVMSSMAVASSVPQSRTDRAIALARRLANCMLDLFNGGPAMCQYMHREIHRLLTCPSPREYDFASNKGVLDDVVDAISTSLCRRLEEDGAGWLFKERPELWHRLMNEDPMDAYPRFLFRALQNRFVPHVRVLEVGAGTGNLTKYISQIFRVTATDCNTSLLPSDLLVDDLIKWDFDTPIPKFLQEEFDVVVAVNSLHCAKDPLFTLEEMAKACRGSTCVILAEGSPEIAPGIPWWGNIIFGMLRGWYDRGGFRPRTVWMDYFHSLGLKAGFSVLRSGKYDLGGLVWGEQ